MHYKTLQPIAFNKLNREMIFNNQKGKVLQKLFLLHNILLKRIFCTNCFLYLELNTFGLFSIGCFSRIFLNGEFISSSKSNMIYIYMFFQSYYAIFLKICYISFLFFCSWIIKDKIYITNHTPHDLRFTFINNVIIIYNEK